MPPLLRRGCPPSPPVLEEFRFKANPDRRPGSPETVFGTALNSPNDTPPAYEEEGFTPPYTPPSSPEHRVAKRVKFNEDAAVVTGIQDLVNLTGPIVEASSAFQQTTINADDMFRPEIIAHNVQVAQHHKSINVLKTAMEKLGEASGTLATALTSANSKDTMCMIQKEVHGAIAALQVNKPVATPKPAATPEGNEPAATIQVLVFTSSDCPAYDDLFKDPVYAKLKTKYTNSVLFVNVDDTHDLWEDVDTVPSFKVIRHDNQVFMLIEGADMEAVEAAIEACRDGFFSVD